MSRLHPVFNVIKLTPAPDDPIPGRCAPPPPPPELVDGEEEYVVEKVLNSRMFRRKLQYLIKWEGYNTEHNSWTNADDVHAPELMAEFHRDNPSAPRHIRALVFGSIPFRSIPEVNIAPSRRNSEGGVNVTGHLAPRLSLALSTQPRVRSHASRALWTPPHAPSRSLHPPRSLAHPIPLAQRPSHIPRAHTRPHALPQHPLASALRSAPPYATLAIPMSTVQPH